MAVLYTDEEIRKLIYELMYCTASVTQYMHILLVDYSLNNDSNAFSVESYG